MWWVAGGQSQEGEKSKSTKIVYCVQYTEKLKCRQAGNLKIFKVRLDELVNPVNLSPTEFKLVTALASCPDGVVDYVKLARLSLGYETLLWEAKELTKRHVSAVRHKLELKSCRSAIFVERARGRVSVGCARDSLKK